MTEETFVGEKQLPLRDDSMPGSLVFSDDGKRLLLPSSDDLLVIDVSSAQPIVRLKLTAFALEQQDKVPVSVRTMKRNSRYIHLEHRRLPQGDLLYLACQRLPIHARDLGSLAKKYGIAVRDAICVETPPSPNWKRIASDSIVH